jgi:hypothetical protein
MEDGMSGRMTARPVWAGVAIKMDDGTTYGFELDGYRLMADIRVNAEKIDDSNFLQHGGSRHIRAGDTYVDIRISGQASQSARFSHAARDATAYQPAEVKPARRAIEP